MLNYASVTLTRFFLQILSELISQSFVSELSFQSFTSELSFWSLTSALAFQNFVSELQCQSLRFINSRLAVSAISYHTHLVSHSDVGTSVTAHCILGFCVTSLSFQHCCCIAFAP